MIPQRITLKGFLCYKEPQSIDFDGNATLWMLAGLNGSGKSAVFDAVTYAMFGYHRGGATGAVELINKDSDTLVVEFDFLLDGKLYRAKRTLKRDNKGGARGTQQLFRYDPAGKNGQGEWGPLEDVHQKRDFDAWIGNNVGLNYDTFTSSVLLLQGKAEKLLDSKPEGRREVLAGIVDLGRYERLHLRADEKRKTQEGQLKALAGRLNSLPRVQPLEIAEAKARITEAEEARAAARAEVERLLALEHQAKAWRELQISLTAARARVSRARQVLDEAASIELAVVRLRDLREVIPRLSEIVNFRSQSHQAAELLKRLTQEREKQTQTLAQKEEALKLARSKRDELTNQVTRDDAVYREVSQKLRKTGLQLQTLQGVERQEKDLAQVQQELKRLPDDPPGLVRQARDARDRLEGVARIVPLLARFAARRSELIQTGPREREVEEQLRQVRTRGEARKTEAEELRKKLEVATKELQFATEQAAEARTLASQAKQALQELQQVSGSKVCRHCGQELTAGHLEEEKRRRGSALQSAEKQLKQATQSLEVARRTETELRENLVTCDRSVQDARAEYTEANAELKRVRADLERLQKECAETYGELPERARERISKTKPADWTTTTYPETADLDALRGESRELETARRKLGEAEQVQERWNRLKTQETEKKESIDRQLRDLPADRQQLREEHQALEAQEKALFKSMDACRSQVTQIDRDLERGTQERELGQASLNKTDSKIKEQQLIQTNSERGVAAQLKLLLPTWQTVAEKVGMPELHMYRAELKQLEDAGTEESHRALEHARHHLSQMQQDVEQLEARETEYPTDARQDSRLITTAIQDAKLRDKDRDEILVVARNHLAKLLGYEEQRAQLDAEYKTVEGDLASHRLLCELLGRERLQLYLVRQAERQVVEYANAVLDRLSGGQLYLKLSGEAGGDGAAAKALELEAYNRATGERPINVAFLSGSQKFRVAVSLALGIGQYASRQHRPIESVIIDEGFGCLDNQGRQVMIQELQNLRCQMRCILLVSHQEDFADAFSDGYQFRLENGATKVERFRR